MTRPLDPQMSDSFPSELSPIRIGDKWGAKILHLLADGALRFSELRSVLNGISAKVLTTSLRSLERDGLVLREVHDRPSPRVEYALTPLGQGLVASLAPVCAWMRDHWEDILEAREDGLPPAAS
ncbi:helix-turn-helix domain-containing protein [Streptomyces sp. NPDC001833]|uniref:winged helix-turn-helix transcriptional regulator n=1 Tax=Streptomyces sp. NPDC001833 TaxID=3154658 RepID=UPI00332CB036